MKRLTLAALVLSALSLVCLACGSTPTTHYYVLAPPPAESAAEASGGVRLGVEAFEVDPPYDQDRLVYRVGRDSAEVGFYNYHRWSAPPGRLVATALVAGLRGTTGLAEVEPARVTRSYSHVLTGRVVALEELDEDGRQLARIQLDLKLFDAADASVVWTRFVTAETDGRAEEVPDVMRQMQAAFAEAVGMIRSDLEVVFREAMRKR